MGMLRWVWRFKSHYKRKRLGGQRLGMGLCTTNTELSFAGGEVGCGLGPH